MSAMDATFIQDCKTQLLTKKEELLNRLAQHKQFHQNRETGGDEADRSVDLIRENQWLSTQERLQFQLLEIENALGRIEKGAFGVCEETEEYIEHERLKAIPWTRLSIEGAEIREALKKKFAR